MLNKCPNKNLQEWKDLSNNLGETLAFDAYSNNQEDIPDYSKAPDGSESMLMKELKDVKNTEEAYRDRFVADTPQFREYFGDWKRYAELKQKENPSFLERQEIEYIGNQLSGKLNSKLEPISIYIDRFKKEGLREEQFQKTTYMEDETLKEMGEKTAILQYHFDVGVVVDPDIDAAGQLEYSDNYKPTIRINPNYAKRDTVFHEGGHLYIDLLGGMSNPIIQEGYSYLEGSKLEEEIRETYPELSGTSFQKEVVATAIGREASDIFDNRKTDLIEKFKAWTEKIFNKLKGMLGLPVNKARQLARELNTGLVREYGSAAAVEEAVQQQKKTMKEAYEDQVVNKKVNLAEKAKKRIERRIEDLKRKLSLSEETNKRDLVEKQSNTLENLENLLGQMANADSDLSLVKFIKDINTMFKALNKKMKENLDRGVFEDTDTAADVLNLVREKLHAFEDIVDDIYIQKNEDQQLLQVISKEGMDDVINDLKRNTDEARNFYDSLRLEQTSRVMALKGGREKAKRVEELKKIFRNNNPNRRSGESKDTYDQREREFVLNKLADESEQIYENEKEAMKKRLQFVSGDLNMAGSAAMSQRNLNDDVIQGTVEMIDNTEFGQMKDFLEVFRDTDDIFQRFEEVKPERHLPTKYDEMAEDEIDPNTREFKRDKKGNRVKGTRLVGKYYNAFYEKKKEFGKRMAQAEDSAEKQRIKQLEYIPWLKDNAVKDQQGDWAPNENWRNPQYDKLMELKEQGSPIYDMYNKMVELATERDKNYTDAGKIGLEFPSINKNGMERLGQNGFLTAIKEAGRDVIGVRSEDTEYGSNLTEEESQKLNGEMKNKIQEMVKTDTEITGEERKNVPIFFRGKIKEGDQSFDLPSMLLMDYYMSLNHSRKSALLNHLNIIGDMMADRKVYTKTARNQFKVDEQGYAFKWGSESNSYKLFKSIVEDRIYGIKTLGDPSSNEWIKAFNSWASNIMLIGNYFVGGATMIQGYATSWFEGKAGEFFSSDAIRRSDSQYMGDIYNIMDDVGRRRPYAKTNLLAQEFDAFDDFMPVAQKFANETKLKQMANLGTLHASHTAPEHYIQSRSMYGVLNDIKVKDKDGNYLTEEGTTTDRKKAMTLADAYKRTYTTKKDANGNEQQVPDGRLKLDERVGEVEGHEGKTQRQMEEDVSRRIKQTNMHLYGNYSNNNLAFLQRFMPMKAVYLLRGWLVPGMVKRWRGLSDLSKRNVPIEEDDKFYDRALGIEMEGSYVSGLRFLAGDFSKKFGQESKMARFNYRAKWEQMSDHEKSNVIRMLLELGTAYTAAIAASVLYSLGEGEGDDEDNYTYYSIAFFAKRLQSEIAFYHNPMEFYRLMRSPAAAMSILRRVGNLAHQLSSSPLERYERTDRKGQLKIRKDVEDLFGFGYTQLNKDIKDSLDFLYSVK